jgi:predicted amidohydrolase YtcJ
MSEILHIHNARIWTGDPLRPWAASIAIRAGRIESLDGHVAGRQSVPITAIDAQGRTITPGLIDAHLHLLNGGQSLTRLNLAGVRSHEEFEAAIARRHAHLAPGEWLIANGWSQENWGGEPPHKRWLRGAGERPVVCYRMDMHVALVSDAVLRQCDLSHDVEGGRIVRDASGEPTGLMIEAAAWELVNPLVPKPDLASRRDQLRAAQRYLHSLGVTAAGSMEYQRDVCEVYAPLRDELTLRCRITLLDQRATGTWDFSFGRDFADDDRLAVIGYKAFIDGTLGSRTARMLHDYADDPGNRGMLVELAARGVLTDWACRVASAGLSPSMHAIGDEAAHLALDVIDEIGTDRRPRIEHAQQIDPADIPRFQGRIASMQPLHKADDCQYVRKRLGEARLPGTFAFRKLLNAGAILAFGSDWPVVSPDPRLGMRTAIKGVLMNGDSFGIEENLTVEETLRAYTAGAAFALGLDETGVLRQRAWGDLVMWDRDPFAIDWTRELPRAIMTVVGGRIVYDAEADATRHVASRP